MVSPVTFIAWLEARVRGLNALCPGPSEGEVRAVTASLGLLGEKTHHGQDRGLQRSNSDWWFSAFLGEDFHTVHLLFGFLPQADLRRVMGRSC